MKKLFILFFIINLGSLGCYAGELEQTIQNKTAGASLNYNRQDTEEVGKQVIINEKSFFNINIQILKKGALFTNDKETEK